MGQHAEAVAAYDLAEATFSEHRPELQAELLIADCQTVFRGERGGMGP
jgi:hypothetical protein